MANIKYPSDLSVMETIADTTHIVVEDHGALKRVPGNTLGIGAFKDLPVLEEITETTHAIVEDGGEFKRIAGDMLGGGGIKTAIVKSSLYDAALAFVADPENMMFPEGEQTFECINMTHAEAVEILKSGKPLDIQFLYVGNPFPIITKAWLVGYFGVAAASENEGFRDAIAIEWDMGNMMWTSAGLVFPEANAASETEE